MRVRNFFLVVAVVLMSVLGVGNLQAQFTGKAVPNSFRDTSMLKPAPGSKVSVIVFEDLGCPGCARAHPIEIAAAEKYHCPLVRYDFPIQAHVWTFEGAVCARYLQDKVNPKLADEYRSAVFLAQNSILNKEDLQRFTQRWVQQHGLQMPFEMDPKGELAAKVKADYDLGVRLHVTMTPTIIVVTQDKYQVVTGMTQQDDPNRLYAVLEAAVAETKAAPAGGRR
jgi:protein-disulfide isomerase